MLYVKLCSNVTAENGQLFRNGLVVNGEKSLTHGGSHSDQFCGVISFFVVF